MLGSDECFVDSALSRASYGFNIVQVNSDSKAAVMQAPGNAAAVI